MSFNYAKRASLASLFKNSKVFYQTFLIFSICIGASVLTSGLIAVKLSTEQGVRQISETNTKILEEKKNFNEQQVNEMAGIAAQLFSNEDIWSLLKKDRLDDQDTLLMFNVIQTMRTIVRNNNNLLSLSFFDDVHDFVLSDVKYTKSDFVEQDLLSLPLKGTSRYIGLRTVNGEEFVTYVQKYSIPNDSNSGYFVISVPDDTFFHDLSAYDIVVMDRSGKPLYASPTVPKQELPPLAADIKSDAANVTAVVDNGRYHVNQVDSETTGWHYLFIQDYDHMTQPLSTMTRMITLMIALVFLLSLFLAFIFSKILSRPLSRLTASLKNHIYQKPLSGQRNEYTLIHNAIRNMTEQHTSLSRKYDEALPYLQKHALLELLHSDKLDTVRFHELLEMFGVHFPYAGYMITIADCETAHLEPFLLTEINRSLNHLFTETVPLICSITTSRLLIIMNTSQSFEQLYAAFVKMKQKLNEAGYELTLSLGQVFYDASHMPQQLSQAVSGIEHKFFTGKYEIICNHTSSVTNFSLMQDKKIVAEMLNCIRSQHKEKACERLDWLIHNWIETKNDIEYVKYACFQICTELVSLLEELGVDISKTEFYSVTLFEDIQKSETLEELKLFLLRHMDEGIGHIKVLKDRQLTEVVRKTIQFLKNNFTRDLTLDEIAASVYLSPRYLSGIFKEETGMTIFDYVTALRMQSAKELLCSTNLKIQDIAESVGYNTTQSFLRIFKKHTLMTPLEFRRKSLLEI